MAFCFTHSVGQALLHQGIPGEEADRDPLVDLHLCSGEALVDPPEVDPPEVDRPGGWVPPDHLQDIGVHPLLDILARGDHHLQEDCLEAGVGQDPVDRQENGNLENTRTDKCTCDARLPCFWHNRRLTELDISVSSKDDKFVCSKRCMYF